MLVTDLIQQVRRWGNEPASAGHQNDTEVSDFLSEGLMEIYTAVKLADQNFFEDAGQIALTPGTQEYEIPQSMRRRSLTDVKINLNNGIRLDLEYRRHQDVPQPPNPGGIPYLYYLRGDTIGFYPVPDGSTPSARITFYRQPNALFSSFAQSSPAANQLVYSVLEGSAAANGRIGRLPSTDSEFVGEIIRFHPGTAGAGQEHRVTAHDVLTSTLTLDTNLSAAAIAAMPGIRFSIVPFLAEEVRTYLVAYAAAQLYLKQQNQRQFGVMMARAQKWEERVLAAVELRRMDEPRRVRFIQDLDALWFQDTII